MASASPIFSCGTHHLGVQLCTQAALDAHGQVRFLADSVRPADMAALQLRPIVALTLSLPAFMFRQVELAPLERPPSITAFLSRMWTSPEFCWAAK